MPAGPLLGELPPPGPLADTGPERPLHPSLCTLAPGCRVPRVRGKRGPRSRLGAGRRRGRRTGPAPGGPGPRSRRSRGPGGNRTRRPGLAWPPEQGTRPPRASGQCSVGRTGLGASRTFRSGWGRRWRLGPGLPGARARGPVPACSSRLRGAAGTCFSLGLGREPGGWAAGGGGRPRWPGVGSGMGARVPRRCTVLGGGDARGAWAGGHLFAGAVWGASAGHPVSGSPRWGWGWSRSPATRARPERPEHRAAGGHLRSSVRSRRPPARSAGPRGLPRDGHGCGAAGERGCGASGAGLEAF